MFVRCAKCLCTPLPTHMHTCMHTLRPPACTPHAHPLPARLHTHTYTHTHTHTHTHAHTHTHTHTHTCTSTVHTCTHTHIPHQGWWRERYGCSIAAVAVSQCCTTPRLFTACRCGLFGAADTDPRFAVDRGNPSPQPVPRWSTAVSQGGGFLQEHRNIRLHYVTLICRAP